MRGFTFLVLAAVAGIGLTVTTPKAEAQVGIDVGVAPECPYGYYDVAPYDCAPTGYYGPEWFNGDGFIGAGPRFHGSSDFQGNIDNRLHPEHGYTAHCQNVARKPNRQSVSIVRTSKETKRGMDVAT